MCSVCDRLQFRDRPREFAVSPEVIIFVHSGVGEVTTTPTTGLGSSQTVPASVFGVRGQRERERRTTSTASPLHAVCYRRLCGECVRVWVPEGLSVWKAERAPLRRASVNITVDIRPELLRCPPPPPALLLCPPSLPPPSCRPTTSPGSPSLLHPRHLHRHRHSRRPSDLGFNRVTTSLIRREGRGRRRRCQRRGGRHRAAPN